MSQVFGEKVTEFGLALQGSNQTYITSEQKVWEKREGILFLETSLFGIFQAWAILESGQWIRQSEEVPSTWVLWCEDPGRRFPIQQAQRMITNQRGRKRRKKWFSHFKALEMFCLWELEDCSRHGLRSLTGDPHLCFYSLHFKLSASHTSTISAHPQCRKLHKGKFVDVLFLIGLPYLPLHVKLVHKVHKCNKHTWDTSLDSQLCH